MISGLLQVNNSGYHGNDIVKKRLLGTLGLKHCDNRETLFRALFLSALSGLEWFICFSLLTIAMPYFQFITHWLYY